MAFLAGCGHPHRPTSPRPGTYCSRHHKGYLTPDCHAERASCHSSYNHHSGTLPATIVPGDVPPLLSAVLLPSPSLCSGNPRGLQLTISGNVAPGPWLKPTLLTSPLTPRALLKPFATSKGWRYHPSHSGFCSNLAVSQLQQPGEALCRVTGYRKLLSSINVFNCISNKVLIKCSRVWAGSYNWL